LTMLDRATDRLCRGGAAVENLAHSASFQAFAKNEGGIETFLLQPSHHYWN
jgi:hypothetical protein